MPTNLSATATGTRLVLEGAAAKTNTSSLVLVHVGWIDMIKDNDDPRTVVPITGDYTAVTFVDARKVTGAGVAMFDFAGIDNAANNVFFGSAQSDYLSSAFGNDNIQAGGGNDYVMAGSGNDLVGGGVGNDILFGNEGDDSLDGGRGNDLIDGVQGSDVATYSGLRVNYSISIVDGVFQVADLRAGAPDGIDRIGNVESLRFADEVVVLGNPSSLAPSISGVTLSFGGTPATNDFTTVGIELKPEGIEIIDSGEVRVFVPVAGDYSRVTNIDVRGLAVPGAHIIDSVGRANLIYGTDFYDYMWGGGGNDRLFGGSGIDDLHGREGNDLVNGGNDNDMLAGDAGADILNGGRGDDSIDGGEGPDIDTAVYYGNRASYSVTVVDYQVVVRDLRSGSPDGVDRVWNVERLQFADQTIAAPVPSTALTAALKSGSAAAASFAEAPATAFSDEGEMHLFDGTAQAMSRLALQPDHLSDAMAVSLA